MHFMAFDDPHSYVFDFERMESFEIGAWLIAILAFPAEAEADARRKAAEAKIAETVRTANAEFIEQWHDRFPFCADISTQEESRRLRTMQRRLRDRMQAARMSLAFIGEHMTGEKLHIPSELLRLSLNELSKYLLQYSTESDPENFEHRVWRRSRPVIHVAAAMQVGMRAAAKGRQIVGMPYDLANAMLHRTAIDLAIIFEEFILRDRRMGIAAEILIKIRYH